MRSKKDVEYTLSKEYDKDRREHIKMIKFPQKVKEAESMPKYLFKKEITELLTEINPKKLSKAKKLFRKFDCMYSVKKNRLLEQIYRGFYVSFKTRHSYYNFKSAALVMLYIYDFLDEDEVDLLIKDPFDYKMREKIWSKHSGDMRCIKEVEDVLKKEKFLGGINMSSACLAIGASISFTLAVKSMLDVLTRLHKDKDYRKSMMKDQRVDWDEAILLRAMPHKFFNKQWKN